MNSDGLGQRSSRKHKGTQKVIVTTNPKMFTEASPAAAVSRPRGRSSVSHRVPALTEHPSSEATAIIANYVVCQVMSGARARNQEEGKDLDMVLREVSSNKTIFE